MICFIKVSGKESEVLSVRCNEMGIRELTFANPAGPALHYDPPDDVSLGDQPLVGNKPEISKWQTNHFDGELSYGPRLLN